MTRLALLAVPALLTQPTRAPGPRARHPRAPRPREPEHPQPDVALGQVHQLADSADPGQQEVTTGSMPHRPSHPGPAEVYAALWLGALLAAAGELPDPFPPPMEELARRYFERFPPEVKA